jgi:hypothetical protein
MHGLPYINESNLRAANIEAEKIIAANSAAGVPAKKAAEFEANIAEATARIGGGTSNAQADVVLAIDEATSGDTTAVVYVDNGVVDYN